MRKISRGIVLLALLTQATVAIAGCRESAIDYTPKAGETLFQIAQAIQRQSGCTIVAHPSLSSLTLENLSPIRKIADLEAPFSAVGRFQSSTNLFIFLPHGEEMKLPGTGRLVSLSLKETPFPSVKAILVDLGLSPNQLPTLEGRISAELQDVALDDLPELIPLLTSQPPR